MEQRLDKTGVLTCWVCGHTRLKHTAPDSMACRKKGCPCGIYTKEAPQPKPKKSGKEWLIIIALIIAAALILPSLLAGFAEGMSNGCVQTDRTSSHTC